MFGFLFLDIFASLMLRGHWRPGLHIDRHRFVKHHLLDLLEFAKLLSDLDWLDNVHTQLMATLHDPHP